MWRDHWWLRRLPYSLFILPVFFFSLTRINGWDGDAFLLLAILFCLVHPVNMQILFLSVREEGKPSERYMVREVISIHLLSLVLITTLFSWKVSLMVFFPAMVFLMYNRLNNSVHGPKGWLSCLYGSLMYGVFPLALSGSNFSHLLAAWKPSLFSGFLLGGIHSLCFVIRPPLAASEAGTVAYLRQNLLFSALFFAACLGMAGWLYFPEGEHVYYYVLLLFFAPVLLYGTWVYLRSYRDLPQQTWQRVLRLLVLSGLNLNGCFFCFLLV